jgi:ferredoxin
MQARVLHWLDAPEADMHHLRLAVKKLRYLLEQGSKRERAAPVHCVTRRWWRRRLHSATGTTAAYGLRWQVLKKTCNRSWHAGAASVRRICAACGRCWRSCVRR